MPPPSTIERIVVREPKKRLKLSFSKVQTEAMTDVSVPMLAFTHSVRAPKSRSSKKQLKIIIAEQ